MNKKALSALEIYREKVASGLEIELTYSKENWFTAKCKGENK